MSENGNRFLSYYTQLLRKIASLTTNGVTQKYKDLFSSSRDCGESEFCFCSPRDSSWFRRGTQEESRREVLLIRTLPRCFGSGILIFNRRRSLKYCRRFALRNSERASD